QDAPLLERCALAVFLQRVPAPRQGAGRAHARRVRAVHRDLPDARLMAPSPSRLIDARIKALGDWRGETLSRVRALIKAADPGVVEEWKWRGVPVWSHD